MRKESDGSEVMDWFTHALRIPTLIGKPPGGGHYPGGPYSVTQVLGAIGLFVTGQITMSLWGLWSGLTNNVILILVSIGALFALRLVKPGGRNPLTATMAFSSVIVPPLGGKFRGRPIQRRLPHRVRNGQINALVPVPAVKPPAPVGAPALVSTAASTPTVELRKPVAAYAFSQPAAAVTTPRSSASTPAPDEPNPFVPNRTRHNPFLPAPEDEHNPFLPAPTRPNPFL